MLRTRDIIIFFLSPIFFSSGYCVSNDTEFSKMYKMIRDHFMTADSVPEDLYNKYKTIERALANKKEVNKNDLELYKNVKLKIEHSSILNSLFHCIIEKSDFMECDNTCEDVPYSSEMIRNCLLSGTKFENRLLTRINNTETQLGAIYTALNFLVKHNILKQTRRMEALLKILNDKTLLLAFAELARNEKEFVKLFSDNDTKRRYGISDYNYYIELADSIFRRKKTGKIVYFVCAVVVTLVIIYFSFFHTFTVNNLKKVRDLKGNTQIKSDSVKLTTEQTIFQCMDMLNEYADKKTSGRIVGIVAKSIVIAASGLSSCVSLYFLYKLITPSNFYDTLSHKFDVIKAYVNSLRKVYNYIKGNKDLWVLFRGRFKKCAHIFSQRDKLKPHQREMLYLMDIIPFKWSYWSQWGSARAKFFCRFFLLFEKEKSIFINPMMEVANFESYIGIARTLASCNGEKNKWSIVKVERQSKLPFLKLKKVWAPIVDNNKAVSNDISFGCDSEDRLRMAVLFGMNAGGKTTLIQSIASSLMLSHVYGIIPAAEGTITPFKKIFIVIDVTTDIEKNQSKFMSELIACDKIIDENKLLKKNNFGFLICDELFCGTNPRDSNLFASNFIKHMCSNKNIIGIYATHDKDITNFEGEYPNLYFVNYHMKVKDDINELKYYYKIERGVVEQQIAIALAADMGRRGLLKNADVLLGKDILSKPKSSKNTANTAA